MQLNLDSDHPPADFTVVYEYTLVEYSVVKLRAIFDIVRQYKIQVPLCKAFEQNHISILETASIENLVADAIKDEVNS